MLELPTLGLRRELPLAQPVTIELGELRPGVLAFRCGMDMLHGRVIVSPRGQS